MENNDGSCIKDKEGVFLKNLKKSGDVGFFNFLGFWFLGKDMPKFVASKPYAAPTILPRQGILA